MNRRELHDLLAPQTFRPFDIVLNDGNRFTVKDARFALLSRTALFLFSSKDGKMVEGPPYILALRNIAQVEPLNQAA